MRKEYFVFLLTVFLLSVVSGNAQDYKTGIGIRGGPGYGLTVKHFVSPESALEAIVSPLWGGFLFTGLYEKHARVFNAKGLNYYGGIGGHVGYWNYENNYQSNNPWFDNRQKNVVGGIDLVLGIEYTFSFIPFTAAVDWKPMLNLINDGSLWFDDVAFSLRFVPGNL